MGHCKRAPIGRCDKTGAASWRKPRVSQGPNRQLVRPLLHLSHISAKNTPAWQDTAASVQVVATTDLDAPPTTLCTATHGVVALAALKGGGAAQGPVTTGKRRTIAGGHGRIRKNTACKTHAHRVPADHTGILRPWLRAPHGARSPKWPAGLTLRRKTEVQLGALDSPCLQALGGVFGWRRCRSHPVVASGARDRAWRYICASCRRPTSPLEIGTSETLAPQNTAPKCARCACPHVP